MRGMFGVSKENILHIDKKIYSNLLESLSVGDNIENGHFAERIWAHLFRQYAFDSINNGTITRTFDNRTNYRILLNTGIIVGEN